MRKSTGQQEPTVAGQRSMEILDEKVNAHLPYNSTLKKSTEEEQSSLKRLEETIPELFQCAVVRQMGIDLII